MNASASEKSRQVDDIASYHEARTWLISAVHELPAGVLWGADGADAKQCAAMLEGLEAFARQCAHLQLPDHTEFIEECRWHFEHYPHYLGRRRHFVNYATYTTDRQGPLRVSVPPVPHRLRVR